MPRSLHVRADRRLIHAEAPSRRHLRVDVVAPRGRKRSPLSLGLVLDRSGSMAGAKLRLAREGATRAVQALGHDDQVSLVAYSDDVQVLIRSGPADEPARRVAAQRLQQLEAGGNTDLCAGWLRGCEQVGLGLNGGRLGRCLLLTDGLANQGITDRRTIVGHATELRSRGVTTSTLGVGRDFDEVLLREMAEAGGGSFYFAEEAAMLADVIAGETGQALKVVARDATLVLDLPEGASIATPNAFRIRSERTRSVVELGDLVEDQVLSLVVTLEIPSGPEGASLPVQCWLWDPNGVLDGSSELAFRYAAQEEYGAEARDRAVDREVIEAYAAAARRRAAELARAGSGAKGRQILQQMAAEVRRARRNDSQLAALAEDLEQEAARLERMNNLEFKRLEFATSGALRSKDEDGFAVGTMNFTSRTLNLMMAAQMPSAQADVANDRALSVTVVTSDAEGTRLVETACQALAAAATEAFAWSVIDGAARILDPGAGVAMSSEDELGLAYALASSGDSVKVAFVRGLLDDGAVSHWHPKERAAIVSLSALGEAPAVPPEALVACELVLHGLRQKCPTWNPAVPVHPPNGRECWGDTADGSSDLERKIRAGDLCPVCREMFGAAGVHVEKLLSLVTEVRALAEPSPTAS